MERGNWNYIKRRLDEEDSLIFQDIDKSTLTDYDKRRKIFDYLCDNLEYDYLLYIDILLKLAKSKQDIDDYFKKYSTDSTNLKRYVYHRFYTGEYHKVRNPFKELLFVMNKHIGVCNSISQYYKLLLEYNDIYSVCVICDNNTPKNHQVTLVYDQDTDSYSFDDVSTAVISKILRDKCFDYDLRTAKDINQGIHPVGYLNDSHLKEYQGFGVILRTEVINYYVGKENDDSYLKYGLEANGNITLPDNIISKKRRRGEDNENTYRYKKSWEDRRM